MAESSPPVDIRQATIEDAELLARLGAALFIQTFAPLNTPENMETYLPTAFSPVIQAAELEREGTICLIAMIGGSGGVPVGYAQLAVTEPPECVPEGEDAIELVRFYVDAAWHGQGVSHTLMEEVLGRAAGGGHDSIWLGVWDENARAIAFYEKKGFAVVGRKDFWLGSDLQTDLVMTRGLRLAAAG
jgi:ribosomal protein S18 acetylase RimI-like enzyme